MKINKFPWYVSTQWNSLFLSVSRDWTPVRSLLVRVFFFYCHRGLNRRFDDKQTTRRDEQWRNFRANERDDVVDFFAKVTQGVVSEGHRERQTGRAVSQIFSRLPARELSAGFSAILSTARFFSGNRALCEREKESREAENGRRFTTFVDLRRRSSSTSPTAPQKSTVALASSARRLYTRRETLSDRLREKEFWRNVKLNWREGGRNYSRAASKSTGCAFVKHGRVARQRLSLDDTIWYNTILYII